MVQRLLVAWCKVDDMFYDSEPSFQSDQYVNRQGAVLFPELKKKENDFKKVNYIRSTKKLIEAASNIHMTALVLARRIGL